jgi:hypothetical protein
MDDPARGAPGSNMLGLLALAAAFCLLLAFDPATRPTGLLRDFNAFYCAGAALGQGADPYLAEPLGSCERLAQPAPLGTGRPALAVPAPLPPYVLLLFALLAHLPYPTAALIWCAVLLAAVVLAVAAMRRATGLPLAAVAAGFVLGDGYASISLGQLAPLAVAGLALAAMFANERRDAAAAWAAAGAMIEPHIGLPGCLALFVWKSGARLPLALAALLVVGFSLWLTGPAAALEYARSVVPAHAISELANEKQFSLSYLAHRLGAGDELALRLGTLSYLAAVALGCTIAGPLAQRLRAPGLVPALPSALALVGGPFLHIAQMPAALPCALLLSARVPQLRRSLAAVLVLLAIPWVQFTTLGSAFGVFAGVVAAILSRTLGGASALRSGGIGLLALAYVALLLALVQTPVPSPDALLAASYDPHALAESSWGLYVRTVGQANLLAFDLARVPTLAGLLGLGWLALGLVARPFPPESSRKLRA